MCCRVGTTTEPIDSLIYPSGKSEESVRTSCTRRSWSVPTHFDPPSNPNGSSQCWVAIDRGLRLAEKRSLPAPSRNKWIETRDKIYEEVQTKGWNNEAGFYSQSYENKDVLDSSILIMPLTYAQDSSSVAISDTVVLGSFSTPAILDSERLWTLSDDLAIKEDSVRCRFYVSIRRY